MKNLIDFKLFEKTSLINIGVPFEVMKIIQKDFALSDDFTWKNVPFKKNLKIELRSPGSNLFIAISRKEVLVVFSINSQYYLNRYYLFGEDDFGGGNWEKEPRTEITITDILNLLNKDFKFYKALKGDWTYVGRINRKITKEESEFLDFTNKFKKEFADNFTRIVRKLFQRKYKLIQDVIMHNLLYLNKNVSPKKAKELLGLNIDKAKEGEYYKRKSEENDPYQLQLEYIKDNSLTIFNEFLIKFEEIISQEFKEFLNLPELCKRFGREKIMTAFMYYIFAGKIIKL